VCRKTSARSAKTLAACRPTFLPCSKLTTNKHNLLRKSSGARIGAEARQASSLEMTANDMDYHCESLLAMSAAFGPQSTRLLPCERSLNYDSPKVRAASESKEAVYPGCNAPWETPD
jgi:hypothetical protein